MKHKKLTAFPIMSLILGVAGLILAPVLCGPLNYDDYTGSYEVSGLIPVMVSTIAFSIAALGFCHWLSRRASQNGATVNTLFAGVSLVVFGLLYGLNTIYRDAVKTLESFLDSWGMRSFVTAAMPEYIEKFNSKAGVYGILMVVALVAFAFFTFWNLTAINKAKATAE